MNIVARLKYEKEIDHLSNLGVDVFLLDVEKWTTKSILPLNHDQLASLTSQIKALGKKVYILLNKMIHEPDIEDLKEDIKFYKTLDIDGLVINDFSLYVIAEKLSMGQNIIYQPGTMNTNSYDVTYLEDKVKGMTLSKEITLDEIKDIINQETKIEFSILGHGFIDMFYSKRKLISLYLEHKSIDGLNVTNHPYFTIEEKTRPGIYFPIFEDEKGTHIFRDKKLESFKEVEMIKSHISDFFIERIFMDDQEYYDAISAYKQNLSNDFLERYKDQYHKGFYYLPTQKVKGEHYEN